MFSWHYNPLWFYFHIPVAGFNLLVFEVSWSHTRHPTVSRTPLNEWSIRHRDLYLATRNTHNRQTSIHPVGIELTIPAGKRPKTYALDCTATGTGTRCYSTIRKWLFAFQISFNCHSINISSLTVYPYEKWIPSDMSRGSKCGWSNTVYLKHATLLLQLTCLVTRCTNCRTGT